MRKPAEELSIHEALDALIEDSYQLECTEGCIRKSTTDGEARLRRVLDAYDPTDASIVMPLGTLIDLSKGYLDISDITGMTMYEMTGLDCDYDAEVDSHDIL